MSKNILILTGSPRQSGNSNIMAEFFMRAAESKGHTVKRIDCTRLHVGGCLACDTCYQNGKPCSVDEAFNSIADDILSADVLVFAMPVYWYTIPAQIKAVIDHLYCFCLREKEEYFGKQCALLACCEEHDPSVLDGVRIPFERMAALSKWEVIGEVLVPGVLHVGYITVTDGPARAAALADAL